MGLDAQDLTSDRQSAYAEMDDIIGGGRNEASAQPKFCDEIEGELYARPEESLRGRMR